MLIITSYDSNECIVFVVDFVVVVVAGDTAYSCPLFHSSGEDPFGWLREDQKTLIRFVRRANFVIVVVDVVVVVAGVVVVDVVVVASVAVDVIDVVVAGLLGPTHFRNVVMLRQIIQMFIKLLKKQNKFSLQI